jgi:uncharacterized sulfatase
MQERIREIAFRYLAGIIAFLPVILCLRIVEALYLQHAIALQGRIWEIESVGFLYDLKAFLVLTLLMFLPFLLISLRNRRAGMLSLIIALVLFGLIQYALVLYFAVNLSPLDEVLFNYSPDEITMIIRGSDKLDYSTFLPVILLILLVVILQWLAARIRLNRKSGIVVLSFIIASMVLAIFPLFPRENQGPDDTFRFQLNKTAYFVQKSVAALFRNQSTGIPEELARDIDTYQKIHSGFSFTSKKYPLVHRAETPDNLGPLINFNAQPPNLVFVIAESLSSAVTGNESRFGSFTPFLDSLKDQSLYWDNFLSASERTFHVFAALFGSLPYANGEFQKDLSQIPFHYSLIRYLHKNGYFTTVYYGSDLRFTNYDQYLKSQETDLLMQNFGPAWEEKRKQGPDFFWGYHDEFTFARSLEVIDSLNRSPRLDIYLTLSTHFPFKVPDQGKYLRLYEDITHSPGFPAEKKERTDLQKNLFASVLYLDDVLRRFIKAYASREDFKNTIFLITGDHFFMELDYTRISEIERYHVPMLIYSPMLKEPRRFESVSSHLDVAPSLIAMLQSRYPMTPLPYVQWLGDGIDTATGFRNIHILGFVTCYQKKSEYLTGDLLLAKDRLFSIRPGLLTEPVNNPDLLEKLRNELRITNNVYDYAAATDHILIPELFMPVLFDTTRIFILDSTAYPFGEVPPEFINFFHPVKLPSDYRRLECALSFRYATGQTADTTILPRLILTIEDSLATSLIYHLFAFPGKGVPVRPGIWNSFTVSSSFDLSSVDDLKGSYVKLYFFNNQSCHIRLDSVNICLNGIN